jgi:hypothetical protein
VNRRVVPDDQEPFARRSQQVIEELDRVQLVERLLPCQCVDLPHRRHPAHHRQKFASDALLRVVILACSPVRADSEVLNRAAGSPRLGAPW